MSERCAGLAAGFDAALDASFAAWREARARGDGPTRTLRLAGLSVVLRLAGARLAPIFDTAFGLLAAPGEEGPADLEVAVLDRVDPTISEAAERAGLLGDGVTRFPRPGAPEGAAKLVAGRESDSTSFLDAGRGRAAHWFVDAARIPMWTAASPLRIVLCRWLATRGRAPMHAATVGTAAGGVLIVGKGGSGKSTATLASVGAPAGGGARLSTAGDDFVAVDLDASPPRAHALYVTAKLERGHAARFPALAPLVVRDGGRLDDPTQKAVALLDAPRGPGLLAEMPIAAIAVPRLALGAEESRIEPATRAEALLALAPSTVLHVTATDASLLARCRALVARVPCVRLLLGRDVSRIPEAIAALLERLARERGGPAAPASAALPPALASPSPALDATEALRG